MLMTQRSGDQTTDRSAGTAAALPCPEDFEQCSSDRKAGLRGALRVGKKTVDRWLDECGKPRLIAARAEFARSQPGFRVRRQCPPISRATYVAVGHKDSMKHYGAGPTTIKRWIEERGGEELIEQRRLPGVRRRLRQRQDGGRDGFVGASAAQDLACLRLKQPIRDIAYYLPTYTLSRTSPSSASPSCASARAGRYKLNKQRGVIEFPGAARSCSATWSSRTRIVGYEVAHSIVDEIDTLTADKARDAWNKIIARNRQKCGIAEHGRRRDDARGLQVRL
jgi:hypothetical protein